MEIKNKLGIPQYICLAYFAFWSILPIADGAFSFYLGQLSESPIFALLSLIDTVAIILIPIGIFFRKQRVSFIGCVIMGFFSLYILGSSLLGNNEAYNVIIYDWLSLMSEASAMFCAAANCMMKKRRPALFGVMTVILLWIGYFCRVTDSLLHYGDTVHIDTFLYSLVALAVYAPYFLLGYCFQESSLKISELSILKGFPKVTFSEVISTYFVSLIISIPIALIFFFTSTVLGIIAIIVFPILFTIAHIKDKPLREKQEEERRKIQVQIFTMQLKNELIHGMKSTNSTPTIDTNRLRNDMMNYYGTAMHSASPMAQADLIHVQRASDAELIREAQKSGFDLNKYTE